MAIFRKALRNGPSNLKAALIGQDVVYANLVGDLERQAHSIVTAMH